MKNALLQPLYAGKIILRNKSYLFTFIIIIPLIAFLLYLIPVKTIPGNSISYQLQLMELPDYLVIVFIVTLESFLLLLYFYLLKHNQKNVVTLGNGNIGILSGIPALLFGMGTCSSLAIPIILSSTQFVRQFVSTL